MLPIKEGENQGETIETLRAKVVGLRDQIARKNLANNVDNLNFPLERFTEQALDNVPGVVVVQASINDEIQAQTPFLRRAFGDINRAYLGIYPDGLWRDNDGMHYYDEDYEGILSVYALITRDDYRVLEDEHWENIYCGEDQDREDERFEEVRSKFIKENEEDLLRSLRGDLERTLERVSASKESSS